MYRKILVPLDGSEFAEAALSHARTLACCTGAEIVLLRVAIQPRYEYSSSDPMIFRPAERELISESTDYLEHVAADLREAGFQVSAETCTGPVAETILDYAQGIEADLIVMSTHGRSGLTRWFIGSVADKVVRGAKLPVLLARPEQISD